MTDRTLALLTGLIGFVLGTTTWLADGQENVLTWLGSLTAPWVLLAFAFGAFASDRRRAIVSATAAMLIGVATYYLLMLLIDGGVNMNYFLSVTAVWIVLAPISGIVFGLVGAVWRRRATHRLARTLAVALMGGVIAGESVFMALTARTLSDGELTLLSGSITLGLMLPLVLLKGRRDRLIGLGAAICLMTVGAAIAPMIRWIFTGFAID